MHESFLLNQILVSFNFLMFVVCGFRESMYVLVVFRCIEFSLWPNHWYDYHDSSFWLNEMFSVTSRPDITDLNNKNRENNNYAAFNKTSFPKSVENLKLLL